MNWRGRPPTFALLVALATLGLAAVSWAGVQVLSPEVEIELEMQRKWVAKHSWAARTGQPRLSLSTVDADVLASAAVDLTKPTRSPAVTPEAAKAVAEPVAGGGRTLEVRLADCYWEAVRPLIDQTCWVVSKTPAGLGSHGPPGSRRMTATYLVVLIDAQTGAFLKAISGS